MNNDNFSAVLLRFVGALKLPFRINGLREELRKHPDYYSLLAYSDVLDNYGIRTSAYNVSFEQLPKLALPAIAYLNDRNYAVITAVEADGVIVSNGETRKKKIKNEEFKKLFTGFVQVKDGELERQATTGAHEITYSDFRSYAALLLGILLLSLFLATSNFLDTVSLATLSLTLAKLAGVFFTSVLLVKSIDANSPLLNTFCNLGEKVDCEAVLSSDAAKLTSFLSWSEVGFFYFAGSLLSLLFAPLSLPLLAWLNLLALPYTFYSIYYQWKVAKKWCTLCCIVQALLWLEFLCLLPSFSLSLSFPGFLPFMSVMVSFLIPVATWMLVKPLLTKLITVDVVEEQLRSIKYNRPLFMSALKQDSALATPETHLSFVLGSDEPKHVITMVASPLCPPCARAHQQIEDALKTNPSLQIRIVFAGNASANEVTHLAKRHFMALNEKRDQTLLRTALADWYNGGKSNYELWAQKYPVEFSAEVDSKLQQQADWVKSQQINQTPTILINGFKMPLQYQLHELKYMLDE